MNPDPIVTHELNFLINKKSEKVLVYEFDELDSTNDFLKSYAAEHGVRHVVARADYQYQGRGRFDRAWESPRGKNLLFSLLLPPQDIIRNEVVTLAVAESLAQLLRLLTGIKVKIKKPNDLLVGKKKLAGILTEQQVVGGAGQYLIVGVGINVNVTKEEVFPGATSCLIETGKEWPLNDLFEALIFQIYATVCGAKCYESLS